MQEPTVFNAIPEQRPDTPLLDRIDTPEQLRRIIQREQLVPLASELRAFLLWSLGQSGGHFGGGLGVVELTLALHYIFNTPEDRLVWDVGHQAYPHKILTQRREQLRTIRSRGGLAAFPSRAESHYDTFGVGHSSTSISAALGMALAARIQGHNRRSIAVMGDGAMTAGMAFEALTHAAEERANLLVVLNNNAMSISHSVGGLSNYFAGMLAPGTLFEEMGFNYTGPVDGHDLPRLLEALERVRDLEGPQFLHVVTTKGKGFGPAESDPVGYHAINKIDPLPHIQPAEKPSGPKYSNVFGQWLCDMAERDGRVVGITPAMREGSDLVAFSERFPGRYFDVAIAEQHAVTLAAGMACDGAKPVVAIYSTFLQRAYDQLIHDVALQNLDVLFAVDRAGQVGEDGPTHAGSFDLTYLRCLPNMVVMAPSNEDETRQMLYTGYCHEGPAAVRYPRGTGPGVPVSSGMATLPLGKGLVRRGGRRIAILAFGSMVQPSMEVAETLDATVADMRFVKPLDTALVDDLAERHELLVTIEENVILGGAGSGVSEHLHAAGSTVGLLQLGLPDRFVGHGKPAEQLADCGLDAAGIQRSIERRLARPDDGPTPTAPEH